MDLKLKGKDIYIKANDKEFNISNMIDITIIRKESSYNIDDFIYQIGLETKYFKTTIKDMNMTNEKLHHIIKTMNSLNDMFARNNELIERTFTLNRNDFDDLRVLERINALIKTYNTQINNMIENHNIIIDKIIEDNSTIILNVNGYKL